jgi:hypothetical protein
MKNNWKKIDVVVEDETTNEQTPEKKTDMDPLEILNHIQKVWKERGVGKTNDSTPGNNETTADNGALSEENNTSTPGDNNEKWKRFVEEERRKNKEKEEKKKKFCDTIKEKEEKLCKKKLDRIAKQLPIETLTCEPKNNIRDKSLIQEAIITAVDNPYSNLMGYQIPEDVMKDGLKDMKCRQEYMENIEKKIKDFGDTIKQFRQQNKDVYMSMEHDMDKNTPFATLPGEWEATGQIVRNQDIKMFTQLPTTNHKDFDSIAQEICDLHRKKNSDYGDAAYESYKEFGITSYVIRLGDKYRRLQSLTTPGKEQQVKSESIQDTLMDLAAYAIMAIEAINK